MAGKESAKEAQALYAAVMLKGTVKITRSIADALEKLRLSAPNSCVIVPADDTHRGMLKKVAEFVTWGEIGEEALGRLIGKRGEASAKDAKSIAKKALKEGGLRKAGFSPVFRLSPPKGGLRTIRLPKPRGDAGYRGEDINRLLDRML
jgi:large subunit ribosomal protein L30